MPAFWLYLACIFLSVFPSLPIQYIVDITVLFLKTNLQQPLRWKASLYLAIELPLPDSTPTPLFQLSVVHVICTCCFLIPLTVQTHFVVVYSPALPFTYKQLGKGVLLST